MEHKALISILTDIEANVDVNHLTYKGCCVWPLIRFQLAIWLMNNSRPVPLPDPVLSKSQWLRKVLKKCRNFSSISIRNVLNRSIQNPDLAFLIRTSERSHQVAGSWYNPYGDSFCDLFEDKYAIQLLEFSDDGLFPKPQPRPSYFLDLHFSISYLKSKLIRRIETPEIKGFSEFIEYLSQVDISWPDAKMTIEDSLQRVFALKESFFRIIRRLNPKLFFITCCYCEKSIAAILACNDFGIPSVEFQHGAQNDHNPFLTNWTKVPVNGYEMLPDLFWNWGEASSDRIRKWTRQSTRHESFIGGNLWISKWLKDGFHTDDCTQYKTEQVFASNYKHLLISLQLWPDSLPDFLVDAIRDSPLDWFWHIRQHPRHLVSYEEIKLRIRKEGNINFDFHIASSMPLYLLLKHIDLHLTGYSTVAFEAAQFKVPTIFYHPNARDGYNRLFDGDFFCYAQGKEQLYTLIKKMLSRNNIDGRKNNYIQIDKKGHNECLEKMFQFSVRKKMMDSSANLKFSGNSGN